LVPVTRLPGEPTTRSRSPGKATLTALPGAPSRSGTARLAGTYGASSGSNSEHGSPPRPRTRGASSLDQEPPQIPSNRTLVTFGISLRELVVEGHDTACDLQ